MDLGKIKNLVKQNGDKFIFVENGEPEIVVMSFNEYQKLASEYLHAVTPISSRNRSTGGFGSAKEDSLGFTPLGPDSSGLSPRFRARSDSSETRRESGAGSPRLRESEAGQSGDLTGFTDLGDGLKETEFLESEGVGTTSLALRPEEIRLEDLPI